MSRKLVTNPTCRERADVALPLLCVLGAGRPGVSMTVLASGHPERRFDLLHDALLRVEPLLVDGAPPT
jgi:hypothetical protein